MRQRISIVNIEPKLPIINQNQNSFSHRMIRPSKFLNEIDLMPNNFHSPSKINKVKHSYRQSKLMNEIPLSLDNVSKLLLLPKIYENNQTNNQTSHLIYNKSSLVQLPNVENDINRRNKTDIDEENRKIQRLLKITNKNVRIGPTLDVVDNLNKVKYLDINNVELQPKKQIKRRLTSGTVLKLPIK